MRPLCAILAIAAIIVSLTACESFHGESPFETSLPSSQFGLRVTDGQLRIWTGTPCEGTNYVNVGFSSPEGDDNQLELHTPSYADGVTPGVEFEYLTLGGPYPGFEVTAPAMPPGFDWRTAELLRFNLVGPPNARGTPGLDFAPIATEISENSSKHPEDTYYFPEFGWLGPAEIAAKNGKEFLTVCTPDPGRGEVLTAVVGVRVTDGTLRFWTGTPCRFDNGVVLTFQPQQADMTLRKDRRSTDIEYISVGGPNPEFTVTHPLPHDFDWHTAKSVLVRLFDTDKLRNHDHNMLWSKTTQLATPIAESAQHPADTYYFEGQGWLNPAEVAARDGTSMETICGKEG